MVAPTARHRPPVTTEPAALRQLTRRLVARPPPRQSAPRLPAQGRRRPLPGRPPLALVRYLPTPDRPPLATLTHRRLLTQAPQLMALVRNLPTLGHQPLTTLLHRHRLTPERHLPTLGRQLTGLPLMLHLHPAPRRPDRCAP